MVFDNEQKCKDYNLCLSMFSADLMAFFDDRSCSKAVEEYYRHYLSIASTPVGSFFNSNFNGVKENG